MADGKVVISTALDNGGLEKGLKGISGKLGGLKNVVTGVAASITAAFSAAAVAVGAITKQAVDAYADYEQLIGGVETLFKDAADKVAEYAEDAFYTVGISANEYMETVTSFSASLISALGGDTAKAAGVANMALTDMADNANKMGTALESIKTAYQGFAKQNYTMLDNLKLGYGGTKTEMERLLADAQKLTGVKYDISNLADVYNAIHAIQVEMGIAGTTAKESEKTISGSAAMTAAAWRNVLTAIAGGGDIDKAINNLVYSVSKYFDNIVPVVEHSLAGIGELIEKIAPALVETVATALIKAIPSLLSAVYQMIIGLAKGIYAGIAALFSGSVSEISAQISTAADSAGDTANLENLASGFDSVAESAEESADETEKAAKKIQKSLAGFDEITKLGSPDKDDSADASGSALGIVPGGAATGEISVGKVTIDGVEDNASPIFQTVIEKILELIEPLRNIDFAPALESLKGFGSAFGDLGLTILEALEWAWFNILVPLAEWTIEEAAPAAIDVLSAAFEALDAALEPVLVGLEGLWQDLEPVVKFVQDTVIIVFQEWERTFSGLADMFTEKGEKIQGIFSGIGEIIGALEPILTAMRSYWLSIFRAVSESVIRRTGFIIAGLSGLIDFVAGILAGDWERVWEGLQEVVRATINFIIEYIFGRFSAVVAGVSSIIEAPLRKVWDGVSQTAREAWGTISQIASDCWESINEFFSPATGWFGELFASIEQTIDDVFYNIEVIASGAWEAIKAVWDAASTWFAENIGTPISEVFSPLWEDVKEGASNAWEGIKETFGAVGKFFEDTFTEAWEGVVSVFSDAGDVFNDIKDGVASAFTKIVNGLIDGINSVIAVPFNGINDALRFVKDIEIIGLTPFASIKEISIPEIPYLAQGAVLPANKPFLAMVGDQKHGTNIEAPLATIQEAVANVMEDQISATVAAAEAIIVRQDKILAAIENIKVGDATIGEAANRYNAKMATIRGGAY